MVEHRRPSNDSIQINVGQPLKAPVDAAAASNMPVSSGAPADGGLKCSPMKHDVFRSALLNAGQSHVRGVYASLRSCRRPGMDFPYAGMFASRTAAAWRVVVKIMGLSTHARYVTLLCC